MQTRDGTCFVSHQPLADDTRTVMFTLWDSNSSALALLQLCPQQLLCCHLIQHVHKEHFQRELSHSLNLEHRPRNTKPSPAGLKVSHVALTSLRNFKLTWKKIKHHING